MHKMVRERPQVAALHHPVWLLTRLAQGPRDCRGSGCFSPVCPQPSEPTPAQAVAGVALMSTGGRESLVVVGLHSRLHLLLSHAETVNDMSIRLQDVSLYTSPRRRQYRW